ncbi:MAG: type IV pilus secretin PilQ [Gammaproteobacteria bacterium]
MRQHIFNGLIAVITATVLIGFAPGAARADQSRALTSIKTISLAGGGVEVELTLSQAAPKPLSFSVDQPAMIVLDLPDTSLGLAQTQQAVNVGGLTSVQVAAANNRTRVVLNLDAMTPYRTRVEGQHLYITLGGGSKQVAQSGPSSAEEKTFGPKSGTSSGSVSQQTASKVLTKVDFHRMPDGGGRVEIGLPGPGVSGNVNQVGNRITVSFPGVTVPKKLQEELGVSDFATPVSTIVTRNTANGAEVVITGSGNFNQMAFQANDTFAVELKPVTLAEQAAGPKQYKGKKLTLNFQNIPVRSVLQILAEFTGKNIVVSGNVNGNITLRLHDVPWDEALNIILKTQGLAMRQSNDVIMIAPASVFARQEQSQLQAQNQIEKLVPLQTAYIQVNYAKAADLASLIKSQKTSLLSERGSITTDPRTNMLIVQDTNSHIAQVRKLVHVLDVPVKQVLIESRIVIANNDFQRSLGARFGVTGVQTGANSTIVTTGSLTGANQMLAGQTAGSPGPYPVPSNLNDMLNVNLPAAPAQAGGSVGQFALSILTSNFQIGLELSALQAEGRGEVVSSPHVITANQQKAHIEQGVEIPYQNAASSGATTVQFKKAVLSLDVTPQITPDNRVLMDIEVHKDSVGTTVATANGGSVPSIDTRVVNTHVLVDNGDTVVLGGIYETTVNHSVTKVPFLGDIPLIGFLFRQKSETNNKNELLVFVTPKILSNSLSQ